MDEDIDIDKNIHEFGSINSDDVEFDGRNNY